MEEPVSIHGQVFELRVIVMMEGFDGKFTQVMLDKDQYKKMGDVITELELDYPKEELKRDMEVRKFVCEDKFTIPADYFNGMKSFYSREEIEYQDDSQEDN